MYTTGSLQHYNTTLNKMDGHLKFLKKKEFHRNTPLEFPLFFLEGNFLFLVEDGTL